MKVREYLTEAKKNTIEFILDQLTNDDKSTDAEMILHISKETHIPIAKISKLVKSKRNLFMNSMMDMDMAGKIVKKYL